MKLRVNADKVNYDPKTNEYTVDINLQRIGYVFKEPIYCYNVNYGTLCYITKYLGENYRFGFSEYK